MRHQRKRNLVTKHRERVACHKSSLLCRTIRHNRIDDKWHTRDGEQFELEIIAEEDLSDGIGQGDLHFLPVTTHCDIVGQQQVAVETCIVGSLAIDSDNLIARAETYLLGILRIFNTERKILDLDDVGAPMPCHADVNDDSQNQVVEYTTHHNHKLGKLASLGECIVPFGFGMFGIMRFIDHAYNGAIAAKGYPADAVFGIAGIGFGADFLVTNEDTFLVPFQK